MSQRTATIERLPMAFAAVKEMRADGLEWGEGYRPLGCQALAEIIQGRMAEAVDDWLDSLDSSAMRDRRNGSYSRHLLTELGDIELSVPRSRCFCPTEVLKSYARRAPEIDRAILAGFVLGLSTRKVGEVLLELLGRKVSAATVSRVAKTLDAAVAAFHARPLASRYKALMLDGVVLARKTGAGALRRPVLVALGLRADGRKEVIDFRLAASESAAAWERFLTDLHRRGLTGDGLEMICADGGQGLIAVLARARRAARRFADAWEQTYPRAVTCLRNDLDDLLTCFRYSTLAERRQGRTTNAIERRFREVRRRIRPMGTFQDRISMDRILFAFLIHENKAQGVGTPLSLTHNS